MTEKTAAKTADRNIYQRLSDITTEISNVAKNLTVSTGNNKSYKAVSEADVLAAVKPIEAKHGVYSYPQDRKILFADFVEKESQHGKRIEVFMRIETTYRFVNVDKPDEYVDMISYGDGVDGQDKAPGKASTYSDKYSLLKAYKVTTGDDPDQYPSEPMQKIEPPEDKQISEDEAKRIIDELVELDADIPAFAKLFKVAEVTALSESQLGAVNSALNKKRNAVAKAKDAANKTIPEANTDDLFKAADNATEPDNYSEGNIEDPLDGLV